ncbi:PBECR2 nuclease fold domain-containing protein, partial [Helicobacter suis]|uniref:putative barnase/colicin E5 family endoribonuclease n=1 Tax=Helicobacter suis TaxID=104628 RepID=UPI0023DDA152
NNQTSLSEALDFAQKNLDPLEFTRLKDMFVKNAGGLYNLMNHPRLESLHLSPYLSKAIEQSARALKNTRGKNFANLYEQIETLLKTTDDQGLNTMIKSLSPAVYDDLLSSLLGSSLARFAQLENPASSFYEFLKYAPKGLEELVAPNMAKMMQGIEGKPLNKANIFDFVHLAIASGETSQFTSKVLDLLPALEKKALAAKNALKDSVEIQALEQAQARSAAEKSALASVDTNLSEAEIKQLEKQEIVNVSYAKWMQAFNLKNTNEPFIPKFAPEVKEALEGVLHGEQIKLTQGSLYKLVKRDKSGLIDYIRPTLENPNMVLDDSKGLLFIKEFIDPDKNRYFMSVAKNYNGEWVFSTHTRKALSAIKNKVDNSKILYNAGFKSGEVASASDMLKSGGTAMKPSDLQINTPLHPSSGLNPEKRVSQEGFKSQEQQKYKLKEIDEATKDIDPKYLPDFDKTHSSKLRFYELWGEEGLNLKPSEVFYKPKFNPKVQRALEPLGYNIQFSQREIHRWGIVQLKEFKRALENPDVIIKLDAGDKKFLTFIQQTPRGIERFSIEPTHEGFNLYNHLGQNFNLKETLQDERVSLIFSNDPELTTLRPFNKAFGTNFEQFYHDPQGAVAKLIQAKKGQVAGAFYREDLGDIDLVWGEGGAKGYGLNKIVKKHLNDFTWFRGYTPKQKLANALEEIVQKGNLITDQAGIKTIWLKHEDEYYLVGLSKGWKGEGDNRWIITSYKKTHGEIPEEVKGDTANLSAYSDKFNPVLTSTDEPLTHTPHPTTPPLKSQERPYRIITDKEAFIKNLDLSTYATPIPKELDVKGFLKSLEGVENKENFIKHLQVKKDAQSRLAYLNLVEPTLREWDIKLTKGNRAELIKRFVDEDNKFFALLITQDADKRLITFIPKARLKYLQDKIRNADLIQTFNGRAGD